ncbi:unnamed protein product [Phaedon cochleariae]|uniref:Apple domain-containing protein n=1 Tax=Phaedon cochleariae TaxID=80249 RepID=A0A9N9SI22_PHACE|nr:unnamed protein product [Phaedon cochleariae]
MVRSFRVLTMATGLAVLGIIRAISIDNHLMPTITDCYERLAIGERLQPDNVYKFFNYNTVAECKKVCSDERKSCKAFAFGISAKGNATCELSIDAIKETADLKPVGTLSSTDFDLYIKKLDCTLVIENTDKHPNHDYRPSLKPVTLGNLDAEDEFHHDPLQIAPGENKPPHAPDSGHQYLPSTPSHQYLPSSHHYVSPPVKDGVHNVQTLVSIASGPESVLNPIHGILVAQETANYGEEGKLPPYKPAALNRPYDGHKTRPDRYDRPDPDYGYRPGFLGAGEGYADEGTFERPHWTPDRPDLDRFDVVNPSSAGYNLNRYGDRPSRIPFRPEPDFLASHRPLPNRYGSLIPHPDEYDNLPSLQSEYLFQQSHQESFSELYHEGNNRPPRPPLGSQGYDGGDKDLGLRPSYPHGRPNVDRDKNTDKNHNYAHQTPLVSSQGYGDRNHDEDIDHNYAYKRPSRPSGDNPNDYPKPVKPRPLQQHSGGYGDKGKPGVGELVQNWEDYGRPGPHSVRPSGSRPYDDEKPLRPNGKPSEGYGGTSGQACCSSYGNEKGGKPIVSHSTGYNGEQITSIITQIEDACFRRVLAGKRVSRAFVKRASICETVEECQKECADEKRFSCEGFNYRLDPSGRGKGECELVDRPLSRLDIGRDLYPHPDYDYYERDRNAASANCDRRSGGDGWRRPYGDVAGDYGGVAGGGAYADRRHDYYGGSRRPPPIDYPPLPLRRPTESWPDDSRYPSRRPLRPELDYDRRRPSFDDYDRRKPGYGHGYDYDHGGNRRGDFSYHTQDQYLPPHPLKPSTHEPYLPLGYYDYQKQKDRLHYSNTRNQYLPPNKDAAKPWGLYDSTASANKHYQYGSKHSYNYWSSDRHGSLSSNAIGGSYLPPPVSIGEGGAYLPLPRPSIDHIVLPPAPSIGGGFVPVAGPLGGGGHSLVIDSASLPAEPRRAPTYNFIKDECSLRSATGFRLHKGIVKKFYAVPNIYECERLCFREKDFPCSSYAFRYTINLSTATDNCYLSNRNYKELDYYTDLEPDKDFDIYTMNNKNRCDEPILHGKDTSDCFWRVRSGQRMDHKIVRDSLIAKSIVDCQLECLKANRFTCRAFSYRYGSSTIGGSIDNCQLTDWPFYELDPRIHFIPEAGFEIYERGSFGHGCEPDHFGIRGQHHKGGVSKADELCYIGFGSPARLLPQATKKSLNVLSELECREECSRARTETLFQCMSFSFRTGAHQKSLPNCFLSDIYQRDLLPKLDYIFDPDFWLFAWDNFNPECVALASNPLPNNHIGIGGVISHVTDRNDFSHALDTWTVYSVSGWPCRRGALCKENREAGFWSCELEGGDRGAWDYCCRPDHRCGASQGYPYQWCYVGPSRTQWRKCSDHYFPYIHNLIDRLDTIKPYLPPKLPWASSAPFRPDRPPAPPRPPPHGGPSLDQYETAFDEEFLDPPKPGGFGQPRHWPVSYLHKEMPPNATDSRLMRMEAENPKYAAIQNLIEVIKSNDLHNIQYHISNESNSQDDVLFVKIPLPVNFTNQSKNSHILSRNTSISLEPVDVKVENSIQRKRSHKALPDIILERKGNEESAESTDSNEKFGDISRPSPLYRRAFITRTNVTMHGRRL